jgi:hypothetical protein
MDIDDLSLETHGIFIKGGIISDFLKRDLEAFVSCCRNEKVFLIRVLFFIKGLLQNQNSYLDDWLLVERFDDSKLFELQKYIEIVQAIPSSKRIYEERSKVC